LPALSGSFITKEKKQAKRFSWSEAFSKEDKAQPGSYRIADIGQRKKVD
jgi:hypothetical protein